MSVAISVEHISKEYRLGSISGGSLVEDWARWWARARRRDDPLSKIGDRRRDRKSFWALDDVSFDVQEGAAIGIVGRNGAGKSTLLKILSRVTSPTEGEIRIRGRVASLLEVGTGFHPELSGRENIFLNGAILGMTKAEIRRAFDDIVAFSECEQFIDTPVKRYSSGMYVRLAFAVAAHLDPEILIVDEVLAVGDIQFQRKCLGKMRDVAQHGRTVIFVSHTMPTVLTLCTTAVLLNGGRVQMIGDAKDVVAKYQSDGQAARQSAVSVADMPRRGSGKAKFTSISIRSQLGDEVLSGPVTGCDVHIETRIHCFEGFRDANVAVVLFDPNGYRLVDVNLSLAGESLTLSSGDEATASFRLFDLRLKPGEYQVHLWIGRARIEEYDYVESAAMLDVQFDRNEVRQVDTFPGTYLCRFDHRLELHPAQAFAISEIRS